MLSTTIRLAALALILTGCSRGVPLDPASTLPGSPDAAKASDRLLHGPGDGSDFTETIVFEAKAQP